MKQSLRIMSILLFSMVAASASAADDDLTAVLRQIVEDSLAAYNREDVPATLRYIHTKSPGYARMQQALPDQFSALDPRTELASLQYIGHDDEFAVARVKLKTVDRSGEPFAANVMDTIAIFHQEDGQWKYWSHHVLGVEIVP
jgi:ketosteroid isomerase-like protein